MSRPTSRRLAPALVLLLVQAACSGDDGASAGSESASATASASASTTAASASATDPSASATDPSASASASASASESDSASASASASASDATTTSGSSTTAGTTDSAGTDATGTDSGATTGATTGATDTSGTSGVSSTTLDPTSTTGDSMGCPEGQEGCPCAGGELCDADLVCEGGVCILPPEPVCGNGVVEAGEECDDGDQDDLDGCTAQCKKAPVCPAGSEGCPCQGGNTCNQGLMCQAGTCVPKAAVCGNKVVEAGEECDDGNNQGFDECTNQCKKTNFGTDPCGFPQDGVWIDINYKNAGSIYSPAWTYSATPGFGEPQWAPQGKNWPEINAKGPPVMSPNDPIGQVVDISSGKWLRIMLGLGDLISYEYATVCITGRSISVGSSVTVTLSNPAVGCGDTTMLSNSWQVHAGGITLPNTCFIAGNDFQALQIEPSGGSGRLGLRSARLTLHKPVF